MDLLEFNILHKVFIILYSLLIIIGFYFDFRDKNNIEHKIRNKIDNEFKKEIILQINQEEKYMLRNLAYEYGYRDIEEFIISVLNNDIYDNED